MPGDNIPRKDWLMETDLRAAYSGGRWREHLLIDECDAHLLETHRMELKWRLGGYHQVLAIQRPQVIKRGIRTNRKAIALARLIMAVPDHLHVDHINRNTLDNRRANLRTATPSQNVWNSTKPTSRSGFRGVYPNRHGRWSARIGVNRKVILLGLFDCPVEAALAYDCAASKLHGEFAIINFPSERDGIAPSVATVRGGDIPLAAAPLFVPPFHSSEISDV